VVITGKPHTGKPHIPELGFGGFQDARVSDFGPTAAKIEHSPSRLKPGHVQYPPARHHQNRRLQLPEVEAHITGTVWKIEVAVGDSVQEGDTVVILESMKMEMPVEAEDPGVVKEILVEEGQSVSEGDALVVLE
jgi:acetyl-CoA carboxylase biotin carboxyl carrier protein